MDSWLTTERIKRKDGQEINGESTGGPPTVRQKWERLEKVQCGEISSWMFLDRHIAEPLPLCIVFFETLSNKAVEPCKLCRHIRTKHVQYVTKPPDF